MLTENQIKTYKEDGFIVVPQVISKENLQAMQNELDKMD